MKARQGVLMPMMEDITVMDETMHPRCPPMAVTQGEIVMRGNSVMKGYLKNPEATEEAFKGGYFHSGDIAVKHPDGHLQIADRAKDIIISGGENVSSVEVEGTLMHHPAVLLCAVVAKPDEKWGEVPCAFVELKPGHEATRRNSSPSPANASPASRRRRRWCSRSCRRPPPARSRNSNCGRPRRSFDNQSSTPLR
jgi:fatty-acyl-CoA synthase